MVYQEHVKRVAGFLSRHLKEERLEAIVKNLWFSYLNTWRNRSVPLLSKFTFSSPGHFEPRVSSRKKGGIRHQKIPENIRSKLDEDIDNVNEILVSKTKNLDYEMLFGDADYLKKTSTDIGNTAFKDKEEIFLDYDGVKKAQDFYLKSKRRYKSERKLAKKDLNNKGRRRKSSLMISKSGKDEERLRALEDLETITRGKPNKELFWRTLNLHFDNLSQSVELEYVVRMYVENVLVRGGTYNSLDDWQKDRSIRESAPSKVAHYLVENIHFNEAATLLSSMNKLYLNDFKHIFYCTIFFVEMIKNEYPDSHGFPCHITELSKKYSLIKLGQIRDRLTGEIDRLEECLILIHSEVHKRDEQSKSGLLDANPQNKTRLENIKEINISNCKEYYPLDDNLIFVLPFIGLKIAGYPITARKYIDILLENPKDCVVNTVAENYKDLLKDDLYNQFMTFKLGIGPYTLHNYQYKFCDFVFPKNEPMRKSFEQFYPKVASSLMYPVDFYVRLMRRICQDLHIPKSLIPLGTDLLCGLMVRSPEYVQDREEICCLAIVYFLLKAFYGLGLNYPSLLTVNKHLVMSEIDDPQTRSNILKCLDYISKIAGGSNIGQFARELPHFDSIFQSWVNFYPKLKRKEDASSVYPQSHEDQANLTYQQMISLIEGLGGALLSGAKERKMAISKQELPKLKERIKRSAHAVKIDITYPAKSGKFVLKEDLQEEIDFILKCEEAGLTEDVELPHSSDVYVKFKMMGSIPLENLTEDILIVYELFTVYSGHSKELMLQGIERGEKLIFELIGETQ